MEQHLPFLLADWGDALKAIVPLIFLAIWILSQLAEAKKPGAAAKEKPRPQPQPRPGKAPAGPPRGEAAAVGGKPAENNVRAEVEEFLRRVRQQGAGEQRMARPAEPVQRPRIEVLVNETVEGAAQPVMPAPRKPLLAPQQSVSAPTADRPDAIPTTYPSSESVPLRRRHLAESLVADHAQQLGAEIGQTDERLEAHLHQKFDHNLGKLTSREATPAEQVAVALATTPASEIAVLLATPQGMQQAIVLSEILRRPTDRW